MKPLLFKLTAAMLLLSTTASRAERLSQELSSGWKFIRETSEPAAPTGAWETVSVPHTWNVLDVQQTKDYYRGEGWYARTLDIPKEWKGKRVFLYFEAACTVAKPYLNGQALGEHRGAFTAFCYELTPSLNYGAANELRVQVNNSARLDVTPVSGDFNMNGGLYRPVRLMVTDAVCITPLDYASPGVYLTLKDLSDERAEVSVKTLVSNGSGESVSLQVETEIKDAAGKTAAVQKDKVQIAAGKTLAVEPTLRIPKPHRWNGRNDPYLYAAEVRIRKGASVVDTVRQPLGLRTVAISEKEGFLLNGKPYPIHGVNYHQERQNQAWALSPANHQEDARLILEMGTTAVRNAHYPQGAFWHDLADRNGLLLWDEIPIINRIKDIPEFSANAELQLREIAAQLHNHPSVTFWSLFNELRTTNAAYPDTLLYHLKGVLKEIDPSRLIVAATCENDQTFNHIADHTTFNLYPGWYKAERGGTERLSGMIETAVAELGKRTCVSEYGAGANTAHHQEGVLTPPRTTGQFHPEEWQAKVHEELWAQIKDNPNLWGSFIWVMCDFSSAKRNEGSAPFLNDKGLVTHDRGIKKDAYFFYKANWNPAPMVHLTARRMTPRREAATEIKAYSNTGALELKVNGKSLGAAEPDGVRVCRWKDVTLAPGKNTVEVTGKAAGKPISDKCEWVLDPSAAPLAPSMPAAPANPAPTAAP